jgi:hypothetical protein
MGTLRKHLKTGKEKLQHGCIHKNKGLPSPITSIYFTFSETSPISGSLVTPKFFLGAIGH